jgi:hypothetical protein
MKIANYVALACCAWIASTSAGAAGEWSGPPSDFVIRADWQVPEQLPPRYRNHCTAENFSGRLYCSDHCGIDYQFYYCSELTFGCCRLGHGYCDWDGRLRCHP